MECLAALLLVVPMLVIRDRRYAFAASLTAGGLALSALPGAPTLLSEVIGNGQTRACGPEFHGYLPALAIALVAVRERGSRLAAVAVALAVSSIAVQRWESLWGGGLTLVTSGVAAAATCILLGASCGRRSRRCGRWTPRPSCPRRRLQRRCWPAG